METVFITKKVNHDSGGNEYDSFIITSMAEDETTQNIAICNTLLGAEQIAESYCKVNNISNPIVTQ